MKKQTKDKRVIANHFFSFLMEATLFFTTYNKNYINL